MMRAATIVWLSILCLLALMYIALYPTFAADAEATKKIFDEMPAAFRTAMNIDVNTMLSFLGFFAFTFTNISLAAGLYGMFVGVSLLSREQRSKTTDFLLSKPRSRSNVFVQKILAGFCTITAVWLAFTAFSFLLAKIFHAGDFDIARFLGLMSALYAVIVWFFACGLLVSQVKKRIKSPLPVTFGVGFGLFVVGIVGAILQEDKIRYISPFRYFDYVDIAAGKGVEMKFVVIALVTIIISALVAYRIYTKKDVAAV